MLELMKRRTIDLLVEQFWKQGYLTISRKYGTYLPEPSKIGEFDVDVIAKYKKNYAIGITLTEEDFNDPNILNRLNFLGTRQTKFTQRRVLLFIGVTVNYFRNAKVLIERLDPDAKRNVRLYMINDRQVLVRRKAQDKSKVLFS